MTKKPKKEKSPKISPKVNIFRPIGWWSSAFTTGTAVAPTIRMLATGGTSGATAYVAWFSVLTSGTWAANTAAGTIYFYNPSKKFTAGETVSWTGGSCVITTALIPNRGHAVIIDLGDVDELNINKSIKKVYK